MSRDDCSSPDTSQAAAYVTESPAMVSASAIRVMVWSASARAVMHASGVGAVARPVANPPTVPAMPARARTPPAAAVRVVLIAVLLRGGRGRGAHPVGAWG